MEYLLKLNIVNSNNIEYCNFEKIKKIGFYFGSFDPFHNGHMEVTEVMLKYCDIVMVSTIENNKAKPMLSKYDDREKMIINHLKKSKKPIYFIKNSLTEAINNLKGWFHLCGIMGSDVYLKLKNPKMGVDEWYIIPRHNDKIIDNKKFNKKTTILDAKLFKQQIYSSTYIRDCIIKGNIKSLPLATENIEYIISKKLYTNQQLIITPKSNYYTKNQNDENIIIDYILNKHKYKCDLSILIGKSGCPVFLVSENKLPKCVVKVFSSQKKYDQEKLSYDFLKFNGLRTVNILDSYNYMSKYFLFLDIAEGQLAKEFVKKNINDKKIMEIVGHNIGKFIRNLHELKKVKITDTMNESQLLSSIRFTKQDKKIKSEFLKNPGDFTYIHGDASLSNFFINNSYDIVTIDAGKLISFTDPYKLPRGFPACDYHRFIFSTKMDGISEKINVDPIIIAFAESYGDRFDIFTKEAEHLFSSYWYSMIR